MYERSTDHCRQLMQLANQAAQSLDHQYIGTEHILLGLIDLGEGVAVDVLKKLDVDIRQLRREIVKIAQPGAPSIGSTNLPATSRGKDVIERAMEEARELLHDYLGSEHILLGLLRVQEGVAAQVLMNQGLTADLVREAIKRFLASGVRAKPTAAHLIAMCSPSLIKDLPADVRDAIDRIGKEIDRLSAEKMKAVEVQEFARAAALRDEADNLAHGKGLVLRDWMTNRTIDPRWLSANDGAVLDLAGRIGSNRSWNLLPKLADALETAGCTDAEMCDHCRQAGTHSDHCWVIEVLLFHAAGGNSDIV